MHLTRKIEIFVYEKDAELRNSFYKQIYGWRTLARNCANELLSYLYSIDRLRYYKFITDKSKFQLEITGVKGNLVKEESAPYALLSERMRGKIPMDIVNCLRKSVLSRYMSSREDLLTGKITLPCYRNSIPVPFSSDSVRHFHWDGIDKKFYFTLFGITFGINLGRDRSGNKEILDNWINEKLQICESSIFIDDRKNKLFLLLNYITQLREFNLDQNRSLDVALSIEYPIIVNFEGEIKKIGNKEEFLYRRLQIQAAMRRAQMNSKYSSGGKGRNRKLLAVEKFRNKEKDYISTRIHTYTKMVVDYAIRYRCKTINLLTQEKQEQAIKNDPFLLRNWSYFGIRKKLEYKAKLNGINMVMKRITFILTALILSVQLYAQQAEICRDAVQVVISGLNSHTSQPVTDLLSKDFSISGYKGDIAKKIVDILFKQINETILSAKETGCETVNNGLKLTYDFEYKTMGKKEAVFIFDSSNQLLELSLIEMKVKTMEKESKVLKDTSQKIIKIPFCRAGNLITVEVFVNDTSRTFLLDSGSPRIVLNSKYFKNNKNERKRISDAKGVGGNIPNLDIYHLKKLCWAGNTINDQDFLTSDLSQLENSRNVNIYGLIGYELLKDYDIVFDYQNSSLTLLNPIFYEEYVNSYLNEMSSLLVPFDIQKHIPVITLSVSGREFRFGIDCGAEANLFQRDYLKDLSETNVLYDLEEKTLRGLDNNHGEKWIAKIRETIIKGKTFPDMQYVFGDISHLNLENDRQLDGLLGYDVLSGQITVLSYKRQELVFFW